MRSFRIATVLGASLLLAACPGDDRRTDTAVLTDTPAVPAPATTPGTPATGATNVTLRPVGAATAQGEATFTPMNNQTQVRVELTGATPGEKVGHIHTGTCADEGPVVADLPAINVGPDGRGTATGMVDLAPMTVMDGQHVIGYHQAGGGHDAPHVVCGEIPGHRM